MIASPGLAPGRAARTWRVRTTPAWIEFADEVQGPQRQCIEREVGDFVLKRADGFCAYQLAVVVDDAESRITRVVRGADLLHSTPRQIYLQRLLQLDTPAYLHVPIVVDAAGEKLSKQTFAKPIAAASTSAALIEALTFLGQPPPAAFEGATATEILQWATTHWLQDAVPRRLSVCWIGTMV